MKLHFQGKRGKVESDARFEFGKNWSRYLSVLNDDRIAAAEDSLKEIFDVNTLEGKTFLDIGSGSGLFSLAAMRLGAAKVHSFDYDPESVACTKKLKRIYFKDAHSWSIEEGSVLDRNYLSKLGGWDVVYSYGVLHHTGAMWQALENIVPLVKRGGKLYIAIYNKQRFMTPVWTKIKKSYVKGNSITRFWLLVIFISYFVLRGVIVDMIRMRNPLLRYKEKKFQRGMSMFYDYIDWIGGYPFETARPEEIFVFYRKRGFILEKLTTYYGGFGNNEYLFSQNAD
ncbi:MAG: methyltransferase type 12 [Nitrospirae bacterium RBG_16_43_11]|nr:MAG: methyltransferase type 12 [Nitrospirae bacterium RBG_16_43_11]